MQREGHTMSDDALTRKSETVAVFSSMATDFDSGGAFAPVGQRVGEVVGIEPGQRVLDVATGRGAVLFPAVERVGSAGEVVGVDLAEGMVRAANEEAERRGSGTLVRVMDAERLDFPDATFDRVVCGVDCSDAGASTARAAALLASAEESLGLSCPPRAT